MTDINRFVELYKSFGIECKVNTVSDVGSQHLEIIIGSGEYAYDEYTKSDKFEGYSGFYSRVKFDTNGKFINQGFWE